MPRASSDRELTCDGAGETSPKRTGTVFSSNLVLAKTTNNTAIELSGYGELKPVVSRVSDHAGTTRQSATSVQSRLADTVIRQLSDLT
eukprot:1276600-Rhodomonas_salina.1